VRGGRDVRTVHVDPETRVHLARPQSAATENSVTRRRLCVMRVSHERRF